MNKVPALVSLDTLEYEGWNFKTSSMEEFGSICIIATNPALAECRVRFFTDEHYAKLWVEYLVSRKTNLQP